MGSTRSPASRKATAIKQLAQAGRNFGEIAHDMDGFIPISERDFLSQQAVVLHRLAAYHEFGQPYARLMATLLRELADKIEVRQA